MKRYERYKDSGVEWIGEIPEHWGVIKLKYVTKLAYGDSLPTENREEEGEVDVFGSNGKVGTHNVANTLSPVIIVGRKGSYGKVTYSDKKCFAIDTTYYIDNRCTKSNIKWLYYSLMVLELDKNSQDTGVPGLSREYAYNKYVPVPTVNEQVAIANFLDQKTAEIDGLIADKEKFIELLQEKRQAMITEAVTKGLNPNVRMKDSGIKCIGEMPEQWNIRKIKYLANIRNVKAGDSDIDKTYIGLENIESETGKLLINRDDEQQLIGETANIFKKGDVLFGKLRPYLAKCIIADFDGRCTSELLVLRTTSNILPEYLYFFMLSPKFYDVVNSSTYGAKMPRASWDFIGNLEIPLPSIKEQKEIVEYLVELTRKIDDLVFDINTQIQKLKEYRQSLIFEAVTGKIDVRDYADN
jgi:restriction endonuclease S subunit